MPCLDISTNINLDGVDTEPILSELAETISAIVGKPLAQVMVQLKGSIIMRFGGSKEPAAYAEIASMDYIYTEMKRGLIAKIGTILETKMGVPRSRFVLKLYHMKPSQPRLSKL